MIKTKNLTYKLKYLVFITPLHHYSFWYCCEFLKTIKVVVIMNNFIVNDTAGKQPLITAASFNMLPSLQPACKWQLTLSNDILMDTICGNSKNRVQEAYQLEICCICKLAKLSLNSPAVADLELRHTTKSTNWIWNLNWSCVFWTISDNYSGNI